MARRDDIVAFADELLDVAKWQEFAPAGLQVVGADEVSRIACGVSSSLELFERAARSGAELVLVHHGLFWRNEPLVVDRRLRGRLAALFAHDLSLVAYHLALDAHPEVGNSALLARVLVLAVILLFLLHHGYQSIRNMPRSADMVFKPAPYPSPELYTKIIDNAVFYSPMKTDQCWYAPLPCTPIFQDKLSLRGSALESGFRIAR